MNRIFTLMSMRATSSSCTPWDFPKAEAASTLSASGQCTTTWPPTTKMRCIPSLVIGDMKWLHRKKNTPQPPLCSLLHCMSRKIEILTQNLLAGMASRFSTGPPYTTSTERCKSTLRPPSFGVRRTSLDSPAAPASARIASRPWRRSSRPADGTASRLTSKPATCSLSITSACSTPGRGLSTMRRRSGAPSPQSYAA